MWAAAHVIFLQFFAGSLAMQRFVAPEGTPAAVPSSTGSAKMDEPIRYTLNHTNGVCTSGYLEASPPAVPSLTACKESCSEVPTCKYASFCPSDTSGCEGFHADRCSLFSSCRYKESSGYSTYSKTTRKEFFNNQINGHFTDVFLFAGQSNCVGQGLVSDLDSSHLKTPKNMLISRGSDFNKYILGTATAFGPDVSFGETMAKEEYKSEYVGILKIAEGDTNLQYDWATKSKLLNQLVTQASKLKKSPQCNDSGCVPKALVWVQGEADATKLWMAKNYEENLKSMVATVRHSIGEPNLFVIVVELPQFGKVSTFEGADEVRAAQQNFVKSQGPSHAALVSTYGIEKYASGGKSASNSVATTDLHYTADGLILLGERIAKAYRERVK